MARAVAVSNREIFRWLEGGYFLVHEYETTFGDQRTQRGINFWGYDSDAGMFRSSSSAATARSPRTGAATRGKRTATGSR